MICSLEGFYPDDLDVDISFRLEQLGSFVQNLKDRGVVSVCFCGAIRRPPVDPEQLDPATLPLVPRIVAALQSGDDAALRTVIEIFEEAGIEAHGAHELAPELLPAAGVLSRKAPDQSRDRDIAAGRAMLAEMGRADLGQACIVRDGKVLLREDDAGTDMMIKRLLPQPGLETGEPIGWAIDMAGDLFSETADWLSGKEGGGAGAILFKGPKPGQDRRVDLPTIGPETARLAGEAGLDGIVIEAGGVMVLEREEVLRRCDAAGLFLWVRPVEGGECAPS